MPLPLRKPNEEVLPPTSYGPKKHCDCGKCAKCKNRERQKRHYDKNRKDILTGDFFVRKDTDE